MKWKKLSFVYHFEESKFRVSQTHEKTVSFNDDVCSLRVSMKQLFLCSFGKSSHSVRWWENDFGDFNFLFFYPIIIITKAIIGGEYFWFYGSNHQKSKRTKETIKENRENLVFFDWLIDNITYYWRVFLKKAFFIELKFLTFFILKQNLNFNSTWITAVKVTIIYTIYQV